ncbi:hypothetical protein DOY81_013913, partial [Sarcophaga bullata]
MHYVSNVLGIKDPIHKQKIALKAMDVVLFGPPRETGTRWKDYILVTLLLSAIMRCNNWLLKRISAEKQLQSAREACEKLRKKRSSLVGAFVSTHGKSIDDVDRSIVEARNSLGEVTNELQERLHRWKQIEQCLGMNIVNNNGLPYLESVLYGRNGGGSTSSIKSSRGRMTSSSDDLDDESVQGKLNFENF